MFSNIGHILLDLFGYFIRQSFLTLPVFILDLIVYAHDFTATYSQLAFGKPTRLVVVCGAKRRGEHVGSTVCFHDNNIVHIWNREKRRTLV